MTAFDKLLYQVNASAELLERFRREPAVLVAEWAEHAGLLEIQGGERISALRFSEEEAAAMSARDRAALNRLGAHPFLQWTVLSAINRLVDPQLRFSEQFVRDIAPYGRPDFST